MVFVGHLISQTPQPIHKSVMKWGMFFLVYLSGGERVSG